MEQYIPYLIGFAVGLLLATVIYYFVFRNYKRKHQFVYTSSDGNETISVDIKSGNLQAISFVQNNDSGGIQRSIELDGHFDGILKLFYPSGNLNKEKEIHGLVADGKATTYYPNGAIYIIDEYKNGSLYKASVVLDENGEQIEG